MLKDYDYQHGTRMEYLICRLKYEVKLVLYMVFNSRYYFIIGTFENEDKLYLV